MVKAVHHESRGFHNRVAIAPRRHHFLSGADPCAPGYR